MSKVKDRIQIRRDLAATWRTANPTLLAGEYGLETDTLLIKIGTGSTPWNDLRYLNKLDSHYFVMGDDGQLTFSQDFEDLIDSFIKEGDTIEQLIITNSPELPQEIANKQYVDQAVAAISTMNRRVVTELPTSETADENIIYLIKENNAYREYILIEGRLEAIGVGAQIVPVATTNTIGGVRASSDVGINQDGFMTINRVSTSALYVPNGDSLTLCGGNAT